MKKIFALLMISIVVVAVVACGNGRATARIDTPAPETNDTVYSVAEDFVSIEQDAANMKIQLEPSATDHRPAPHDMYVLGDHVNERLMNTTDSPIMATYMAGETVSVICEENGWYHLANDHFIRADLLTDNYDDIVAHYRESNADLIVTYISRGYTECWYYGEKLFDGKCVTGDANNSPTPLGLYWITSRQTDVDMMDDPGLHADYFCTFNGLIGYHDASWRTEFGPGIYLTNGSHGCINCEYELAQNIFNHCQVGITAVLILP